MGLFVNYEACEDPVKDMIVFVSRKFRADDEVGCALPLRPSDCFPRVHGFYVESLQVEEL